LANFNNSRLPYLESRWREFCSTPDLDIPGELSEVNRRTFFGSAFAGTGLLNAAQAPHSSLPSPVETRKGEMLYCSFGKTGESVSVIRVGGSHIRANRNGWLSPKRLPHDQSGWPHKTGRG